MAAKKRPLLDQMSDNPKNDWTIADVQKVCKEHGIELKKPSKGSHYMAVSPHLLGHQSIPYKRPIKPVYIKDLVTMIRVHIEVSRRGKA